MTNAHNYVKLALSKERIIQCVRNGRCQELVDEHACTDAKNLFVCCTVCSRYLVFVMLQYHCCIKFQLNDYKFKRIRTMILVNKLSKTNDEHVL